jgi:hypothetical protein
MTAPGVEVSTLLSYLRAQRRHVLGIVEGLDDEALRRAVLPSGWTCLGMLQHLAVDVERWWFRAVVANEQSVIEDFESTTDDGWVLGPDVSTEAVFDLYRREADLADAIISATSPDAPAEWWPEKYFGTGPKQTLRQTLAHVIAETACHAGHLDAVRELIDGRTWLVMP